MPTAWDRLITCPAVLRTLRANCCRPAPSRRSYTAEPAPPKPPRIRKFQSVKRLRYTAEPPPKPPRIRKFQSVKRLRYTAEPAPPKPPRIPKFQSVKRRSYTAEPAPPKPPRIRKFQSVKGAVPSSIKPDSGVDNPYIISWKRIDYAGKSKKALLWAEALQYNERAHGFDGVIDIFSAMVHRRYSIPTTDTPEAAVLWGTLLKHPKLVMPVLKYAEDIHQTTGAIYPRLYEKCMAYWLPKDAHMALEAHHRMVVKFRLRKLPLRRLAQLGKSTFSPWAMRAFMNIYRTSNERDLYDEIVPMLCEQGNISLARRWHIMCSHRGDLPSPAVSSHPVIQLFLAEFSRLPASNAVDLIESDRGTVVERIRSSSRTKTFKKPSKYNMELMRRLTGQDAAPVRFDDPFCARLFATKAFPPASIISGLVMVGVNQIGPQALRVLAQRTDPITELPERFKELKAAGIALQGCVFSLALEKFATEGKFDLAHSLVLSDQHPDVFEDAELQKNLLDYYLEQDDRPQAHRTLAILALFHNDISTESWNLMLQARIRRLNPTQLLHVLQDMRIHGVLVSEESMTALRSILRLRRRGHKPIHMPGSKFDDLRFLSRVYIMILEGGMGQVYPLAWRELIRRFGMLRRFRELRRLLFRLLFWYAPRSDTRFANLPKSPFLDAATARMQSLYPERWDYFNWDPSLSQMHPFHPIQRLFPRSLQQGLIVWGFRTGLLPRPPLEQPMLSLTASKRHYRKKFLERNLLRRLDWTIGLKTVVELRDYGVRVHPHTVSKALEMQFIVLFGRGRSRIKQNGLLSRVNRIKYADYIRKVNEIWGRPLFPDPAWCGTSLLHRRGWHPRRARRNGKNSYTYSATSKVSA